MLKQAVNFGIKVLLILLVSFCFITCGIEEYYFLPQVEQNQVNTDINTYAIVNIPRIPSEHYYATGYRIYYRIYLSGENNGTRDNPSFSSTYNSDYNYFYNTFNNPSNTTSSIPTITTFSGRGYYELDYYINTNGGILEFWFPATGLVYNPYVTLNSNNITNELKRYSEFVPSDQHHERFFRNTDGLKEAPDSTSRKNLDVTSSGQTEHAYAAMYIVAVGQNPQSFTIIYGKPTFISVFKLPNI